MRQEKDVSGKYSITFHITCPLCKAHYNIFDYNDLKSREIFSELLPGFDNEHSHHDDFSIEIKCHSCGEDININEVYY